MRKAAELTAARARWIELCAQLRRHAAEMLRAAGGET